LIRLFYWQVIKSTELKRQLMTQLYKAEKIIAQNGNIYDSFGNQLTQNEPIYHLSLYKPNIKNLPTTIQQIKSAKSNLSLQDLSLLDKFENQDNLKWITLKTAFTDEEKNSLSDDFLDFSLGYQKKYPFNNYAYYILDGVGEYYKKQLQGKTGFSWSSKDAVGKTILTNKVWTNPPINGRNLEISINPIVQNKTETILKNGVINYQADSGSVIILSPQSGEILAMAHYSISTPSATRNPIISDLYEPGSIFKPLVVTMALDSKSISPSFVCLECHQPRTVGKYTINNWDKSFHPDSTLPDIIKNSDNIGMSYVIQDLGLPKFREFFHQLNLDRKTNVDIGNETRPLAKDYWPDIDFYTASFGQGFAVTQIQMISAFNTLGNNGYWVKPHVVKNQLITDPKKIFQKPAIDEIKNILSYAVKNSPVNNLKPSNMDVCAKSGTAQVAVEGEYTDDNFIASYIGFSPCNNPKFTMLVTINNPKSSLWGSSTAAPIWYEIASGLMPLL